MESVSRKTFVEQYRRRTIDEAMARDILECLEG
jgi:hypothetical protein